MAYDNRTIEEVKKALIEKKFTLAVAESVTSGHLQAAFSTAQNTTYFFHGGITAYNLGQKARHLSVDPIEAENTNCVSLNIAKQMALGVSSLFSSNIGVAITGYAAPVPELGVNSLYAYYAISRNGKIIDSGKILSKKQGIHTVQLDYTNKVLKKLAVALK